jgi:hypothetical protein
MSDRYKVSIGIEYEGNSIASARDCTYDPDSAGFGWCMGQEVASAFMAISDHLSHANKVDFFLAITDRAREEQLTE